MKTRISDAIVIVEPDQPGGRPACVEERGGTPILVHLLRQLLDLGIDHVTLSAPRAYERSIRPVVAGHDGLPVCDMVPGPRQGPDSSAAAFHRCRLQLDSIPILVTRASLLPEPGTWLDTMLDASASNAALFRGRSAEAPSWSEPVSIRDNRIIGPATDEITATDTHCFLSGTYALDVDLADALFRSLGTKEAARRRAISLDAALLEVLNDDWALEVTESPKTAWLWAEVEVSR